VLLTSAFGIVLESEDTPDASFLVAPEQEIFDLLTAGW
jgi:hypothetical protein